MRQHHENDRKLRTISLFKYSKFSIAEIDQAVKARDNLEQQIIVKAESLQAELLFNVFPTENDCAVIFYVTGYCCRSLVKSTKCNACKTATIADVDAATEITTDLPDSVVNFFNSINRGGLWKPTLNFYNIGILCWKVFAEITQKELKKIFLTCLRQRDVFIQIVNITFYNGTIVSPRHVPAFCHKGHNLIDGMSIRFFNCLCKNSVKDISDRENNRFTSKVQKLCSKRNAGD